MLCLPRSLHFEVHKVLLRPGNLHLEVHKALRLLRNLHFEVHKVLCLPGNLHFEVHKVLFVPQNLHLSHMSKSYDSLHLSRNQSSSRTTPMSKVLCLPRNRHFEVKPLQSLRFKDFERYECAVNSSELAVHPSDLSTAAFLLP